MDYSGWVGVRVGIWAIILGRWGWVGAGGELFLGVGGDGWA